MSEDLPAPDGPMMAVSSPGMNFPEMFFKMVLLAGGGRGGGGGPRKD